MPSRHHGDVLDLNQAIEGEIALGIVHPVSYTHLDVYKRQIDTARASAALAHAARIDRMIKGAGGSGDVWDEFLRLGLSIGVNL